MALWGVPHIDYELDRPSKGGDGRSRIWSRSSANHRLAGCRRIADGRARDRRHHADRDRPAQGPETEATALPASVSADDSSARAAWPASGRLASIGAPGRTRTGMAVKPTDFKSVASTNFATRARDRGPSVRYLATTLATRTPCCVAATLAALNFRRAPTVAFIAASTAVNTNSLWRLRTVEIR